MRNSVRAWAAAKLDQFFLERCPGGAVEPDAETAAALDPSSGRRALCWRLADGKTLRWELRDRRAEAGWHFAMTPAFGLAPQLGLSPQQLAQEMAVCLNEEPKPAGWLFAAEGGYVNAYFDPQTLRDFLEAWPEHSKRAECAEAYPWYRLGILKSALLARGVRPLALDQALGQETLSRFSAIFTAPESEGEAADWEKAVSTLASRGALRGLAEEGESALLAFVSAI